MDAEVVNYIENNRRLSTPYELIGIHSDLPIAAAKAHLTEIVPTVIVSGTQNEYHSSIFIAGDVLSDLYAFSGKASSPIKTSAAEKRSRRYLEYVTEFEKLAAGKTHLIETLNRDLVWESFKTVIDQLLASKPQFISFDLTEDNSIFFKSVVKDYNIYLEVFFDEDEARSEAVLNVYKDGKVTLAYGGELNATLKKITELSSSKDKIVDSTSIPYEISGPYFATATL